MDLQLDHGALDERLRQHRVDCCPDAARSGQSSHDHHRNARLHDISFLFLLVVSAIAGVLLLAA